MSSYPYPVFRLLVYAVIILCAGAPAGAAPADIYTVVGVSVDATAATEVAAKEASVARGKAEAFRILLERIILAEDRERLEALDEGALERLIRDVAFSQERFGGGRYLADLTVRFLPDAVREFLRDRDVPFAETVSRPILVLPVLQAAGATMLWDDGNNWLNAWNEAEPPDGLLPLVVPLNDLSDTLQISAEKAVALDAERLDSIVQKYDAASAMVAVARMRTDPKTGAPELKITTRLHGPGWRDAPPLELVYPGDATTTEATLVADAVPVVISQAEELWKRRNLLRFDQQQVLSVLVPLSGLEQWVRVRRTLADIAAVRHASISQITLDEADVDLAFVGNMDQLQVALAQEEFSLSYSDQRGRWVLTALR